LEPVEEVELSEEDELDEEDEETHPSRLRTVSVPLTMYPAPVKVAPGAMIVLGKREVRRMVGWVFAKVSKFHDSMISTSASEVPLMKKIGVVTELLPKLVMVIS